MRKPSQRKFAIVLSFLAITRGRPPRPQQLAALPKLMHFRVPDVTEQELQSAIAWAPRQPLPRPRPKERRQRRPKLRLVRN